MSSIFGPGTDVIIFTQNSTFLQGAQSVGQALDILDQQITITPNPNLVGTPAVNPVLQNLGNTVGDIIANLSNVKSNNVLHSYSEPATSGFSLIDVNGLTIIRNSVAPPGETYSSGASLPSGTYNDYTTFNGHQYLASSNNPTSLLVSIDNFQTSSTQLVDAGLTSIDRIFVANNVMIVAVSGSGYFWYSSDGSTWLMNPSYYDNSVNSFIFQGGTYMFSTEQKLYSTTDLSVTATQVTSYDLEFIPQGKASMLLANSTQIWFTISDGGLTIYSTNQGVSWSNANVSNTLPGTETANVHPTNNNPSCSFAISPNYVVIADNDPGSGTIWYNSISTLQMSFIEQTIYVGSLFSTVVYVGNFSGLDYFQLYASDTSVTVWVSIDTTSGAFNQSANLPIDNPIQVRCSDPAVGGSTVITYVPITENSGLVDTYNVLTSIQALETANQQVRASVTGFVTVDTDALVNYYDHSASDARYVQPNTDSLTNYTDNTTLAANYLTQTNAASTYYPLTNPASYITSSALSPYLLSSTASSTYYLQSNPSGYITNSTSSLSNYTTTTAQNAIDATQNTNISTNATNISNLTTNTANGSAISTNALALTKLAQSSTMTILGNNTDETGNVTSLTANQAQSVLDTATDPYEKNSVLAATYATLVQFGYLLRPNCKIVAVSGGSTTPATGQSYSTIASALAAASSGQLVIVLPGTYNESSLTIPAGVELQGLSREQSIISFTATSTNTMITVGGAGAKMTQISLQLSTATNGASLTGVSVTGTNNSTFLMNNCLVSITSTSTTTDSNYCVNNSATGTVADPTMFQFRNSDFQCYSSSTGTNRCVLNTGNSSNDNFDSCQFSCVSTGAGSNFIAFENNGNSSTSSNVFNSYLNGTNSDLSQTVGSINLGKSTQLMNATTNGLSFNSAGDSNTWIFHYPATLNVMGVYYIAFGTYTGTVNETQYRISRPTVIYNFGVNARVAPGATFSCVFTIRKNAVSTALTFTLSGTNTVASDTVHAVSFAAGDLLAVQVNASSTLSTLSDFVTQFDLY